MKKIFLGKISLLKYIRAFTMTHGDDTIYRYSKLPVFPIYILHELKEAT